MTFSCVRIRMLFYVCGYAVHVSRLPCISYGYAVATLGNIMRRSNDHGRPMCLITFSPANILLSTYVCALTPPTLYLNVVQVSLHLPSVVDRLASQTKPNCPWAICILRIVICITKRAWCQSYRTFLF